MQDLVLKRYLRMQVGIEDFTITGSTSSNTLWLYRCLLWRRRSA